MGQLAFVLIDAEVGRSREIIGTLRGIPGVREVHVVTGPYSLIAVLEAETSNAIGRLVAERIHTVSGVQRTITCLSLSV